MNKKSIFVLGLTKGIDSPKFFNQPHLNRYPAWAHFSADHLPNARLIDMTNNVEIDY